MRSGIKSSFHQVLLSVWDSDDWTGSVLSDSIAELLSVHGSSIKSHLKIVCIRDLSVLGIDQCPVEASASQNGANDRRSVKASVSHMY